MASVQDYLCETTAVWEPFTFRDPGYFSVSECWQGQGSDYRFICHRDVPKTDVQAWLSATNGQPDPAGRKCLLRIVQVHRDRQANTNHIDSGVLDSLLIAFQQQLVQRYFQTQFAGVEYVGNASDRQRAYVLCIYPKFAATVSQLPSSRTVNVICFADASKLTALRKLLECTFVQNLAHSQLSPALIFAILCSGDVDTVLSRVKGLARKAEARTGHHEWGVISDEPAQGDLFSLSAQMSGCRNRLASTVRKIKVSAEIHHFILEHLDSESDVAGRQELAAIVKTLAHRLEMQKIEMEYTQSRVQTQKDALFHLTAERDAADSHKLSRDSHALAEAAQNEASSMKALAVVTLFFVPGTFVSSLFSTSLFQSPDQDSTGDGSIKKTKPGVLLYLAISCPLMIVTLFAWALWAYVARRKREAHATDTESEARSATEVLTLALRRKSASSRWKRE